MMGSRRFRAELKRALPEWERAGIIGHDGARVLEERYRLGETAAGLTVFAAYVLGALLVGGGVISLVAWNWDAMSRPAKLIIILGAMLAAELGGYYLAFVSGRWAKLGQGLLFLGTLIFGADLGLMAQIFHVSSHWQWGAIGWGAGAWAVAWAVESTPIALLAIAAATVGVGSLPLESGHTITPSVPALLLTAFVPLALRKRSILLFVASIVSAGWTWTFAIALACRSSNEALPFAAVSAAGALLIALAMMKRDAFAARACSVLGFVAFVALAYLMSFHGFADLHLDWSKGGLVFATGIAPVFAASLIAFLSAVVRAPSRDGLDLLEVAGYCAAAAVTLAVLFAENGVAVAVVSNLALAITAIVAIVRSVGRLDRGLFWFGVLLAGAVIVSRFFELETGLLAKGLAFVLAGAWVIAAGLQFEKRIHTEGGQHAHR